MKNLVHQIFNELIDISNDSHLPLRSKYIQLKSILERVSKDCTKEETLQFSNLFSRLSFVCNKYGASRKIHSLRVTARQVINENDLPTETEFLGHLKILTEFLARVYDVPIPGDVAQILPKEYVERRTNRVISQRIPQVRVEVFEVFSDHLLCYSELDDTVDSIRVQIHENDINDQFISIHDRWKGFQVNLVNVEIDAQGVYHPRFLILEPDYLLDISSISECIQEHGSSEFNYLISKFTPKPNTKYIRLGNFANLVVDELFAEPDLNSVLFSKTFEKDFKNYPFEYTACTDIKDRSDFVKYWQDAEIQFENIKRVVSNDFIANGISIETSLLEPSFLNNIYGIQGRLDILELQPENRAKIVELKSGSTPFPEDGISIKPNHRSQLYLYYQLIGTLNNLAFSEIANKTEGYILYSKVSSNNLRYDKPDIKRIQKIFDLRNRIILNEHRLASDQIDKTTALFDLITPECIVSSPNVNDRFRNILTQQIVEFLKPIREASIVEQKYFYSFAGFIAKEQYLSKIGNGMSESNNGLASLWLNSFSEKKEQFRILYDLVIQQNLADKEEQEIRFKRVNSENDFVDFREGDLCVLYPRTNEDQNATSNQTFKCSISKLSKDEVIVCFRYRQRNTAFFEQHGRWALELDHMDSSFRSMYRNLYSFISSPKNKRNILLTLEGPAKGSNYNYHNTELSNEQNRILNKALSSKDYFLLNGPPGTGKTSIIIRELVREIYKDETSNILLLAYTNRAVDEICDAVNEAIINFDDINDGIVNFGRSDRNFVRIGNELSCSMDHKHNLLSHIIESKARCLESLGEKFTRETLQGILEQHRIYISTVASVSSKDELFQLKDFDTVIIDESSQILEPHLIGILPRCKRFILIGDHKQLPAIVLQEAKDAKINEEALQGIGLKSRKNSLFERLYTFCEQNSYVHAFDKLTFQGRMHKDLVCFPNHTFYQSELKQLYETGTLSENTILNHYQFREIDLQPEDQNPFSKMLSKERLLFIPSKSDTKNHFGKSNDSEVALVIKLVKEIRQLYRYNNKTFDSSKTIGIIAPYRNQIAKIKLGLEMTGISEFLNITVDTVERFQGSQRDIIILTFSINNPYQLEGIVNLNDQGDVDRKLNVALTRAREQMILIGNDSLLSENLIYFKLIEFIKSRGGYIYDSIDNVVKGKFTYHRNRSENTVEGKTYTPDSVFEEVFNSQIIERIKNDPRTEDYPILPLGIPGEVIRNNIIEYGRTDFDKPYCNRLSDQRFNGMDKVLLYCYYNMRKHYFSGYSIFDSYIPYFQQELLYTQGRTTFIDFGCGPLTSGIAFNQVYRSCIEDFKLRYIGIDISQSMIRMAKSFSRTRMFNDQTSFQFLKDIKDVDHQILNEWFRLSNTVILNFSYLFANLDTETIEQLVNEVNAIIERYRLNKYILIYQNPVKRHHGFDLFKKQLRNLDKSIVRKSETVSYINKAQSFYDKSETFTYEILTN